MNHESKSGAVDRKLKNRPPFAARAKAQKSTIIKDIMNYLSDYKE